MDTNYIIELLKKDVGFSEKMIQIYQKGIIDKEVDESGVVELEKRINHERNKIKVAEENIVELNSFGKDCYIYISDYGVLEKGKCYQVIGSISNKFFIQTKEREEPYEIESDKFVKLVL